jgi:hypothetical protein
VVSVGGLTHNEARFRITGDAGDVFRVYTNSTKQETVLEVELSRSGVTPAELRGLKPDSWYGYDYVGQPGAGGVFKTFPVPGTEMNVTMAFGSCLFNTHSSIFDHILERKPDLFLFSGDMFYGNVEENDVSLFNAWYRDVHDNGALSRLLRRTPIASMWDDHDYGPNDSNRDSPSRNASREAYSLNVPHYEIPERSVQGIYQAYTMGRVRVVLTDCRSEADLTGGRMWSKQQEAWFVDELSNWQDYAVILWLTSVPWIGAPAESGDSWSKYSNFRTRISNVIADFGVENLIILSGDAHMVAMDDGSNSDYATDGGAGVPVFHAGPLSNAGSSKGGGYSEGCAGYLFFLNEQYGVIDIIDNGVNQTACVRMRGYADSDVVMALDLCTPFTNVNGTAGAGSCELDLWPAWMMVALMTGIAFCLVVVWLILKEELPGFTFSKKQRFFFLTLYIAVVLFNLTVPFYYKNIKMHVWVPIILFLIENIVIVLVWALGKRTLKRTVRGDTAFDTYGLAPAGSATGLTTTDTVHLADINMKAPESPHQDKSSLIKRQTSLEATVIFHKKKSGSQRELIGPSIEEVGDRV